MTQITEIPGYNFPITPGHEIAGVIYSLGDDVDEGMIDAIISFFVSFEISWMMDQFEIPTVL